MENMETYFVLLVCLLVLANAPRGDALACRVEYSYANATIWAKWEKTGDDSVAISEPPCLDHRGKYLTRECKGGKWYPEEPPICVKLSMNSNCPKGFLENKGNCLRVAPSKVFDELCAFPGLRYYNYSRINTSGIFWMPIRKINSSFIYTSIDKRYGMEFKMQDANITKGCFTKQAHDIVPSDCDALYHHVCAYKKGYFMNSSSKLNRTLFKIKTKVRLILNFDKRREKVILKIYSPEKLANMTEENDYAVYCFTDASVNEMKTAVKKKLVFNSLISKRLYHVNELVYQMSIKHPYAGQYWCEAFTLHEQLVHSNKIIAYKKRKGNEYSLRVILESICAESANCSWLSPEVIYKYLNEVNFNVIFDRIQVILRVMKITESERDHRINVLFHISTQRPHNIIGEYFRLNRTISERMPADITFIHFRSSEVCLPEAANGLSWNLTQIGNKIASRELCVGQDGLPVIRRCDGDFLEGAIWGDHNPCWEDFKIAPKTQLLFDIATSEVESKDVETMKNLTMHPRELTSLDLFLVATTLKVYNSSAAENEQEDVFENMVDTVENVMESKAEVLKESQIELNATDTILDSMDKFLRDQSVLQQLDNEVFVIRKEHVIVHITKPFLSNVSGIAVYDNGNDSEVVHMMMDETFDDLPDGNLDISVYIPTALLETLVDDEHDRDNLTVITTIFNNDKLFNSADENANTSGRVVSVSIPDYGIYLKEPIPLLFRNDNEENKAQCSFWEYGMNAPNKTGHWSSSGGSSSGVKNSSYSECAFTHLTHFALLILSQRMIIDEDEEVADFDEVFENLDRHHENLTIITLVGCTLSLIGISGIFITAICFRRWRAKVGSKILLQLSITICLEMIVVHLAGSDYFPNKTLGCDIVGVCLHYVVLSKFSWMFVSAILQYIRFVKVLSVLPPRLVLKTMIFGWCVPLIPVVFVSTIWSSNYSLGAQNFCYPTGMGLYLGLFLPVVIIVAANLLVFTLIMTNILGSKVEGHGRAKKTQKLQIYLGILLFFMLGMPWVFGILAEMLTYSMLQIVFVYLFCLTATLQGSVLFIFYILLNKDTRNLWMFAFREERSSYK